MSSHFFFLNFAFQGWACIVLVSDLILGFDCSNHNLCCWDCASAMMCDVFRHTFMVSHFFFPCHTTYV
jgi:hypothetical protein